eukprot:6594289-Prorocentrum_lima.AAC.1
MPRLGAPQLRRCVAKVLVVGPPAPRIANYGTGLAPIVSEAIGPLAMNAVSAGRVALRHPPAHSTHAINA